MLSGHHWDIPFDKQNSPHKTNIVKHTNFWHRTSVAAEGICCLTTKVPRCMVGSSELYNQCYDLWL
jgi:hypothetical protein